MPFKRISTFTSTTGSDPDPVPSSSPSPRRASMASTATMTLQPSPSFLLKRSPSTSTRTDPSIDGWANYDGRDLPALRNYTNDLCDFLRETAPPPPPAASLAPPSSGGFLKKYLRKKDKHGTPGSSTASFFASAVSLNRNASTVSLSPAKAQAINKAMHNVPPPDVEPQVFANGQTIYMVNSPSWANGSATEVGSLHRSLSSRLPKTLRPSASLAQFPPSQTYTHVDGNLSQASLTLTAPYSDLRFDSASTTEREDNAPLFSDVERQTAVGTYVHRASVRSRSTHMRTPSGSTVNGGSGSPGTRRESYQLPPQFLGTTVGGRSRKNSITSVVSTRVGDPRIRRSPSSSVVIDGWVSRDIAGSRRQSPTRAGGMYRRDRAGSDAAVQPVLPERNPNGFKQMRDRSASLSAKRTSADKVAPPMAPVPSGPLPAPPAIATMTRPYTSPRPHTAPSPVKPSSKRNFKTRTPTGVPSIQTEDVDFSRPLQLHRSRSPPPASPSDVLFQGTAAENMKPLERQMQDVIKMNEAYFELSKMAKQHPPSPSRELPPPPPSVRTSVSSNSSNPSIGVVGVASPRSVSGPPKLPLPPSPPSSTTPLNSAMISAQQAQIASLTYALQTQRTQYDSLGASLIEQQKLWEDQRVKLEARITELEDRDRKREARIEEERHAWERERKGLRWLVTAGRMGEATAVEHDWATSVMEEGFQRSRTIPSRLAIVEADEDEEGGVPLMTHSSSSRPGSSLESVDDNRRASGLRLNKRHSMYEPSTTGSSKDGSKRPLSAALEDMLAKLRHLEEEPITPVSPLLLHILPSPTVSPALPLRVLPPTPML